jgi:probable F420-dependent oxidoreductase
MKFGLFAINYGACADPDTAVKIAQHAEAAGFESVWTGEHVVLPDPQPSGFALPPTLPMLDSIVALTLVAAHTTTIKVASGIIVLPLRNPVVLAKELASVDVVAKGRLIVGVGAGYVAEEFAATGVPMTNRGERMDDYIRALRALWSMEHPQHNGPIVSFAGVNAYPRPIQLPGPPIVVGGASPGALRRAITMADGWYGFNVDLPLARQCVESFRQMASRYERPAELDRLELTMTPVGAINRTTVEQYEELGVDRLVLLPQPDAGHEHRHTPVPAERIIHNIDSIASMLI